MEEEITRKLETNNYLKEKIMIIKELIKKGNNKEAYFKLATILEYINIKYIKHKYDINIEKSTVINIVNIYKEKDERLFNEMIAINAEYNQIEEENITNEDIEYFAGTIDSIYEYMLDTTGKFI